VIFSHVLGLLRSTKIRREQYRHFWRDRALLANDVVYPRQRNRSSSRAALLAEPTEGLRRGSIENSRRCRGAELSLSTEAPQAVVYLRPLCGTMILVLRLSPRFPQRPSAAGCCVMADGDDGDFPLRCWRHDRAGDRSRNSRRANAWPPARPRNVLNDGDDAHERNAAETNRVDARRNDF
jgi:hypothetical protein